LTNQTVDLAAKRLQLLHEALPSATHVLVPFNPDTPYSARYLAALKAAAPGLRLKLTFRSVRSSSELRSTLTKPSRSKVDVLMPADDASMQSKVGDILEFASRARVPVVYPDEPLVRRGVLLSYAVYHPDLFRRAAWYVDQVLKGVPPANLPVEQPTRFKLIVNLKTARALGITIPDSILVRADEVIR
jgi:putative ABC transport system substrate-binding protein